MRTADSTDEPGPVRKVSRTNDFAGYTQFTCRRGATGSRIRVPGFSFQEGTMFAVRLSLADHVRLYSIHPAGTAGWEIRFEEDQKLQRLDHYRDWHRVERTLALFEREVLALKEAGWMAN